MMKATPTASTMILALPVTTTPAPSSTCGQRRRQRRRRPTAQATRWLSFLVFFLSPAASFFYTTNAFILSPLVPLSEMRTTTASYHNSRTATATTMLAASSTMDNNKKEQPETAAAKGTANKRNLADQFASSSTGAAAMAAAAAVNAAVSMKELSAPDSSKSYISRSNDGANAAVQIDNEGLPLSYDKDAIEKYWAKEKGALNKRWGEFVGKTVPFLTKMTTLFIRDGKIIDEEIPALSKQARMDLQELGPTFIKLGQMMSVRPDVLPPSTLLELEKLQDSVQPFDTAIAVAQIERELGGPLGQFFASISNEPVAAASLAQVYKATLLNGTNVAIKVQRPDVLSSVSKDLYVLRRAAEVFNGLVQRFAPQQRTDYVSLLNEWAVGFYTELDFANEAQNQIRLRNMLLDKNITNVRVPKVYEEYCTRRILVSEWVDGKKLSDCPVETIARVTPAAQEAFLTQLFEVGFFHADPHPGNLMVPNDGSSDIVLIDCGLMASIDEQDRDYMISAVIHLANKNYAALVDDFIKLKILPADSNRATIIPLMDKALTPYVKGGGAKKYEAELLKLYGVDSTVQSKVGGFQAMTQDAVTVLQDVPFSIPPYFAILGRAIVTLEGVALTGNPDYGIIMEAYPFIARKLLREGRPEIQKALYEVLYTGNNNNNEPGGGDRGRSTSGGLKLTRLLALLNNAAGAVATQQGAAFVDLDTVPENGISLADGVKFLLSDQAESLRTLLEPEVDSIVDIMSRQLFRRAVSEAMVALTPPRPPSLPFIGNIFPMPPALDEIPLPLVLPGPTVRVMTIQDFVDAVAPKLNSNEELFAIGIADGAGEFLGKKNEIGAVLRGDRPVVGVQTVNLLVQALRSGVLGRGPDLGANAAVVAAVRQNLLGLWDRLLLGRASAGGADEISDIVSTLTTTERERLDGIVNELLRRALQRVEDRLH